MRRAKSSTDGGSLGEYPLGNPTGRLLRLLDVEIGAALLGEGEPSSSDVLVFLRDILSRVLCTTRLDVAASFFMDRFISRNKRRHTGTDRHGMC